MITVSGKQVREIEYLIHQSLQGHHVLFEPALLKDALHSHPSEAFPELEGLLETLLTLPSLAQKRAFLDRLSETEQAGLLRLWLNVVENSLYQSSQERH